MAAGLRTRFVRVGLYTFQIPVFRTFFLAKAHNPPTRDRQMCSNSGGTNPESSKVLYLNSSGSDNWSYTGETARQFLEKYTELHPSHLVEEINLWDKNLLGYDLAHVKSKLRIADGNELPDDKSNFSSVKDMALHLLSANKLIISCPMWNFSVPYVLKQYIDCVVQPDLTFRETERGLFKGLMTGRPLLLITSSAVDYSVEPIKKLDFQVPYLKAIFGFIGFRDFRHIYIANTKKKSREELMEHARKRIEEEVVRF